MKLFESLNNELKQKAFKMGKDMLQAFGDGINSVISSVISTVQKLAQSLSNIWNSIKTDAGSVIFTLYRGELIKLAEMDGFTLLKKDILDSPPYSGSNLLGSIDVDTCILILLYSNPLMELELR